MSNPCKMQPCTHSYLFGIATATKYNELLNHPQNVGDRQITCTPLRQVFYDGLKQYLDFIDNMSADDYDKIFVDVNCWDINVETFADWFCANLNFIVGELIEPNITEWAYYKRATNLNYIL